MADKIKYGLDKDWLELTKIQIIKETPKGFKTIRIDKYGNYKKYYEKEWVINNFFDSLQEAQNYMIKIISEKKEIAKTKYEKYIAHLDSKAIKFSNYSEKEFTSAGKNTKVYK